MNLSKKSLTAHYETDAEVEFKDFKPGEIVLHTFTSEKRPVVLAQMWYPGWKAEIDGDISLQINVLNKAMMSVDVPAGEHVIRMYYDRRDCKIAFVIQCAAAIITFLLILICRGRKENARP